MNIAREIAKLRREGRTGRVVTVDELEALCSLLRAARDGIVQRHGCAVSISILSAIVDDDERRR